MIATQPAKIIGAGVGIISRLESRPFQRRHAVTVLRSCRARPAVRGPARAAWARRCWSVLATTVQQAIDHTALGRARAVPGPGQRRVPALDEVLAGLRSADWPAPQRDRAIGDRGTERRSE